MLEKLKPYARTVVALVIGVLQVLALYISLSANGISPEDQIALIGAVIIALGGTGVVYQVPNTNKGVK